MRTYSRVVFEFIGGPRDGELLCCYLDAQATTEAGSFYAYTERGTIGKRFWCMSEYGRTALRTIPWSRIELLEAAGYRFGGHVYEVTERRRVREELIVRTRHVCTSE